MRNKKSLLALLLLSAVPMMSSVLTSPVSFSPVNQTAEIKKAVNSISESYCLNTNPSDPNRPSDLTAIGMQSASEKKGIMLYATSLDYNGIGYKCFASIDILYNSADSFWNIDATYTIKYKKNASFHNFGEGINRTVNSSYVSIISTDTSDSNYSLLKFKLKAKPSNDVKLITFKTNTIDVDSDSYATFLSGFNNLVGNGNSRITSRYIYEFKRNADYTLNNGSSADIYVNVDSKYTANQIISQVSARDLFGLDVMVFLVENETTYVTGKLGDYVVKVSATDTYGQTSKATINVHVLDYTAPVITLKSAVSCLASSGITQADFRSKLTVTDNVDTNPTVSYSLPTGFSFDHALSVGTYVIQVTATDSSKRSSSLSVSVEVLDNIAPEISRLDGTDTNTIVKLGVSAINDEIDAFLLSLFKATDNVSSSKNIAMAVIDSTLENKVGIYKANVTATDEAKNTATVQINLEVVQDLPPVFILSDSLVSTDIDHGLSLEDLLQISAYMLKTTPEDVEIVSDSHYLNTRRAGTYAIQAYSKSSEEVINFDLQVADVPLYSNELAWNDWIVCFFQSLGKSFSSLFSGQPEWIWTFNDRTVNFND